MLQSISANRTAQSHGGGVTPAAMGRLLLREERWGDIEAWGHPHNDSPPTASQQQHPYNPDSFPKPQLQALEDLGGHLDTSQTVLKKYADVYANPIHH